MGTLKLEFRFLHWAVYLKNAQDVCQDTGLKEDKCSFKKEKKKRGAFVLEVVVRIIFYLCFFVFAGELGAGRS